MKLTVLLNGIDDVPLKDLKEKTPLEVAKTQYLTPDSEELEIDSSFGLEGLLLSFLGHHTPGRIPRGPLEACSLGFRLSGNQRAYSARFVSTGDDTLVDVADSLLSHEEGKVFCSFLNATFSKKGWSFLPFNGPQAVLILDLGKNYDLSPNLGENPVDWLGRNWLSCSPSQNPDFLSILNKMKSLLSNHEVNLLREEWELRPVNALLFTDGGSSSDMPHERLKSTPFLFTPTAAFIGLAKSLGIPYSQTIQERKKFDSLPGLIDQTLSKVVELGTNSQVIWDIPHLWHSTYKGDLLEKIKTIEWLDKNLVEPMVNKARNHGIELEFRALGRCDIRTGRLTDGSIHRWRF